MSEASRIAYAHLCAAAAAVGLACRGGFHPQDGDGVPVLDDRPARTLVLLGFTGREQWPADAASPEYGDGAPHPSTDGHGVSWTSLRANSMHARSIHSRGRPGGRSSAGRSVPNACTPRLLAC